MSCLWTRGATERLMNGFVQGEPRRFVLKIVRPNGSGWIVNFRPTTRRIPNCDFQDKLRSEETTGNEMS